MSLQADQSDQRLNGTGMDGTGKDTFSDHIGDTSSPAMWEAGDSARRPVQTCADPARRAPTLPDVMGTSTGAAAKRR